MFRVYLEKFFVNLTFLGSSTSFQTSEKLQKLFTNKLLTSPVTAEKIFTFKVKLPTRILSGLVYKYKAAMLPMVKPNILDPEFCSVFKRKLY